MRYYSSIEVAEITGLSRAYLSALCKEYRMTLIDNKYRLNLHQWVNLLKPKYREKMLDYAYRLQPISYIPIFSGVIKVTETYHIIPSKLNYLETL